jgi:hypothetical protein
MIGQLQFNQRGSIANKMKKSDDVKLMQQAFRNKNSSLDVINIY